MLNCEGIVDTSTCGKYAILGTLQVFNFSKYLLEDSTDPPQIWSAESQEVHNAKLQSFWVFVERRCRGEVGSLHVSPWHRKL